MQKLRLTARTGAFAVRHRLSCFSPASPCGPFTVELFTAEGLSLGPRACHGPVGLPRGNRAPGAGSRWTDRGVIWRLGPDPVGGFGSTPSSCLHGCRSPRRANRSHEPCSCGASSTSAFSRCLTDFIIHGRTAFHRAVCLGRPASDAGKTMR